MSASTNKPASHKLFLAAICILAATPVIKIGDVQLLEIFLFLHLFWLVLVLITQKFRTPLDSLWRSLGTSYAIFFVVTLLLAVAALRFRFYPPLQSEPLLKQPFILSIARSAELFLGVFHMLYLASILRDNHATRLYAVRFYFWTGFATALFAIVSIPVKILTDLNWGVYVPNLRARGLFNEGGPYGLYLISIVMAALLLYHVGGLTKRQCVLAGSVVIPVFVMSQSKAAISACLFLFLLYMFIAGSIRIRISFITAAIAIGVAINFFTTIPDQFAGYVQDYLRFQQIAGTVYHGDFGGRIAGAILLPRMLAAHPVTGIGLGNYPILFNDPNYLQGLPSTDVWELPGMGIVEYMAELGLPLFIYLLILLFAPAWMALHKKSLPAVCVFAAVQPLVHIFGTQLNFYYPWICSGFALSFLSSTKQLPIRSTKYSFVRSVKRTHRTLPSPVTAHVTDRRSRIF